MRNIKEASLLNIVDHVIKQIRAHYNDKKSKDAVAYLIHVIDTLNDVFRDCFQYNPNSILCYKLGDDTDCYGNILRLGNPRWIKYDEQSNRIYVAFIYQTNVPNAHIKNANIIKLYDAKPSKLIDEIICRITLIHRILVVGNHECEMNKIDKSYVSDIERRQIPILKNIIENLTNIRKKIS